jgi:hypothetical protein
MAIRETSALVGALRSIRAALPSRWSASVDSQDGTMVIGSPAGQIASFKIVAKLAGPSPRAAQEASPGAGPLYAAEYIAAPTRAKLEQEGVSYADGTGWVWIVSDNPMLAVTASGAAKSPKPDRDTTAITRLDGRSAGRIVRTLVGVAPPKGVRELAAMAGVSAGTISKTLPTLVADGAVQRDSGRVVSIDRRQLLSRWTADYQVLRSNGTPGYFVAPRGLDNALAKLCGMAEVAITGARAGQAWLPEGVASVVPITQLMTYVADSGQAAETLGLVPVEPSAANTILLTPQDSSILDNPDTRGGVPVAPLAVVLADLLTLPGRYPQQAEALMDALGKADPNWRIS